MSDIVDPVDERLIELLRSKMAEELSFEELDQLRERLVASAPLRAALAEHLQTESFLAQVLGNYQVSPEHIITKAKAAEAQPWQWALGVVLCLALVVVIGAVFVNAMRPPQDPTLVQKNKEPDPVTPTPSENEKPNPDPAKPEKPETVDPVTPPDPKKTDKPLTPVKPPDPPMPVKPPPEPWEAALANENPPLWKAVAFDNFDTTKSLPQRDELRRWFEAVPGQRGEIQLTDRRLNENRLTEMDGVLRLRAPWKENTALRLSLESNNKLRMHFYRGTVGVTIVFYEDDASAWAAYATTRKDAKTHEPLTLALTATDDGRSMRSEYRYRGPVDVRWQKGELILSRGDVVMLRAPLPEPPADVYFDGRTAFYGIALVPTKDEIAAAVVPPVTEEIQPASLPWVEKLSPGAKFTKNADGSIEIVANQAPDFSYVTAPLGQLLPCEVILEMQGATSGSGVYLGPSQADNVAELRFLNDTRFNPPVLAAVLRMDEWREGDVGHWKERITPLVRADQQYVRLVGGAGIVRQSISPDGVHWALGEDPFLGITPGVSNLTLDFCRGAPNCRLKLNKIIVRQLPALAAQADMKLLPQVPVLTHVKTPTISAWLGEVLAKQPAGVATSNWRRTCALRSLAEGCDIELGSRLVQLILDDAEARQLPLEELLALYNEAHLLVDTKHNYPRAQQAWGRYAAAAARANFEGRAPFSTVRMAMFDSPVTWRHNLPVGDEKAIRNELVQLMYGGKWEQTLQFCRMLRFYQQQQRVPLVEWAEATAARQLPGRAGGDTATARLRGTWRPLLVEELSKDAYNVLAEMQAILESDAFDDAARMITSISPDAVTGVAPHGRDRQLLVSLPSAIRLAVHDYPQLQEVMHEKFGALAQLRVRQSINANNVAAVELAAVQFEATEAAAEAHRWLGDRSLSSGEFARALAEYERAMRTAPATLKLDLQARQRLAAAMQGNDLGTAVTRPVTFGETNISPSEFETIVAEMKQANTAGSPLRVVPAAEQRVYPAPAMSSWETSTRAQFDGPFGTEPNQEVTRDVNNLKINWCERQISTLVENNVLYLTNRFHVSAYNLDNGQRMWATAKLPGIEMRAREWTLVPMRPVVTNSAIYVRMLYGSGPTLACFDKSNGKLLWNSEQRYNEFLVSDPLLVQGQLVALTMQRAEVGQSMTLRLTVFDRESGETTAQYILMRLNEVWWQRRAGEVTPLDDGLIATLGGLSISCDLRGTIRWIRRPIVMPPEEETTWLRQSFERPLLVGQRVLLAQPGVRSVECVDVETGRLAWSAAMGDIESVIGVQDGRVLVRTETAFIALDLATGKQIWKQPHGVLCEAVLLGGPGGMAYIEKQAKANTDRFSPRMVWLDPATGATKGAITVDSLEDREPHFGPIVAYKDRLWVCWGRDNSEGRRELVEMTPKGNPTVGGTPVAARDPWGSQTEIALRQPAEALVPDWTLLGGGTSGETGRRDDVQGEKNVLGICVRPQQPVLWTREFAAPAGSHPKLQLRINQRGDQEFKAKISVQMGGQTIWSQDFNKDANPNQWRDFQVDLSALAGKTGTLVTRVDYLSGPGEMQTWWRRLEVVP